MPQALDVALNIVASLILLAGGYLIRATVRAVTRFRLARLWRSARILPSR